MNSRNKRKSETNILSKDSAKQKKIPVWLVVVLLLNALCIVLSLLAKNVRGFAPWYSRNIYPIFQGSVGRLSGLFAFSLSEFLLYALPIVFIVVLIAMLIKKRRPAPLFKLAAIIISALLLLYQANCGVNYYNTSFAETEGFTRISNDKELLIEFCEYIVDRINENSVAVSKEVVSSSSVWDKSQYDLTAPYDQTLFYMSGTGLPDEAVQSMERVGTIYKSLGGYYPHPKGLVYSRPFSNMGVTGIYSPFTIEANYNSEMTPYNLPFTACHELSHLKGYMNESEANFIAFLACVNSDNLAFQRSGYMLAWVYAGNQLYKVDRNTFNELRTRLPEDTKKEFDDNNLFWDKYETKASEVQDTINDEYLKEHGIPEGIQSYNLVVELMLSWYAQNI